LRMALALASRFLSAFSREDNRPVEIPSCRAVPERRPLSSSRMSSRIAAMGQKPGLFFPGGAGLRILSRACLSGGGCLCFRAIFILRRLNAIFLFSACERESEETADIPVGSWVIRTAESVLSLCCPPGPEDLNVFTLHSSKIFSSDCSRKRGDIDCYIYSHWIGCKTKVII